MPMIVVGADTMAGESILAQARPAEREVRVFVTDESKAQHLKSLGYKVATGDVSDESHVEGAALRCFSAVLVSEAADDDRERSFADTSQEVLKGWARAVANAGVRRVIWVTDGEIPETEVPEVATVKPDDPNLPSRVITLDNASSLP
jgi:putative NADH-flavin reductase